MTPDALQQRLAREREARVAAEALLESKSRELYDANQRLEKTAASLETQRVQLNKILDNALAAIFLVREDLSILRANKAAVSLFGLGEDYFVETSMLDLFDGPPATRDWISDRFLHGETPDESLREAVGRKSDGATFPMEFGVAVIDQGEKRQSVWIVRDVTRRRREEERRLSLERELSQTRKFEALGTLASGVAHEINTPVQYVSDNVRFLQEAFAELSSLVAAIRNAGEASDPGAALSALANQLDDIDADYLVEEAPQALEQSLHGLSQVASIVKAIKEFSHPGATEMTPTDINELITTTLTVTRNQWKYVAEADMDLAEDLPLVPVLPSEINQVFLNLVVNAVDAIAEADRGGLGRLRIVTRAETDHVKVTFSDSGCGIPDDIKARIFDPFFTTKDVGSGSGQGLALAYNIIHMKHGGAISVDSRAGDGATFTIELPIAGEIERTQEKAA